MGEASRHGRAHPGHLRNAGAAMDSRIKSGHDDVDKARTAVGLARTAMGPAMTTWGRP